MDPARGSGECIAVTYNVARTRITIALSVIATINNVVRIASNACFIGAPFCAGCCQSISHSLGYRYAPGEIKRFLRGSRACATGVGAAGNTAPHRNPDQSSATRMESLGFEGSYFTLACCPATSLSNRTWLSKPVTSCAV